MIVAIPVGKEDAARAERLLDLIGWFSDPKPDHCVLIVGHDVHPEVQTRLRLSAEVGFKTVDLVVAAGVRSSTKPQLINGIFSQAASYLCDCYKDFWLWLEADCVPLVPDWHARLETFYLEQPRRYVGRHMQVRNKRYLSRVAIYPREACNDLVSWFGEAEPFERLAAIIPRTTNTALFEISKYADGIAIPVPAVILNGDRTGRLVEKLMDGTDKTVVNEPSGSTIKL